MLVKILVVFILNGILVESRNIVSEKNLITDLVCNEEFWTLYQEYTEYEQNIQNDLEKDEELANFFVDISRVYRGWLSKIKDHSSKEFLSLSKTAQNRISSDPASGRIALGAFLQHLIGLTQNAISDATTILHNIIQPADHISNRPQKPTTLTPVHTTEHSTTTLTLVTTEQPTPDSNEHSEANEVDSNATVLNASIDSESQPPQTLPINTPPAENIVADPSQTQNNPNENTAANAVDTVFHNLESSSDVTTPLANDADGESTTVHQDSTPQDSGNSTLNYELNEKL